MMTRGLFAIALSCLALFCTAVATQSFFSEPRKLVLGFGSFFGVGGIGLSNVRELQNAVNTSVIAVNKAGDCENIAVRNAETANSSRYTYWKGAPCGMVQALLQTFSLQKERAWASMSFQCSGTWMHAI